MLRLTPEQMGRLDEVYFFSKLKDFVLARCRRPALRDWVIAQLPDFRVWRSVWPEIRHLDEHDCAVLLTFLGVCGCEGLSAPAKSQLPSLRAQQGAIKQLMSTYGYFGFCDFDSAVGSIGMDDRE